MFSIKKIVFSLLFVLLLTGCKEKGRFYITHFDHAVEVKIKRFDLDFIALDTTKIVDGLQGLERRYPAFYPFFLSDILMMNPIDTLDNATQIKDFLKNTIFAKVHEDVKSTFKETSDIEEKLSTAFSYLHYYFPDNRLPEVYFFVSGFNREFIQNKSFLGVGIDLYLGANYPVYKDLSHDYLIPNMRREMLVTDILSTILHNEFTINSDTDLLNTMIYEGKILFLLSIIMPEISVENITGFSKEQLNWFKVHEKEVWGSMVANKHLYSTDNLLISQYIHKAPFTSPVSQSAPGKLGVWMGWQIVQYYMQNNKQVGLQDLMYNSSAHYILEHSMFRPK